MVIDDQNMELDEPSNTSIAPSTNSVSVESCSSYENNTAVVMMDDLVVIEDVLYFSSGPALELDEDTEFLSNDLSATAVGKTCPSMIEHQSITHSLTQEFSNHNTKQHFLDSITDHQNPAILGDSFNEVKDVLHMCVVDAGKTVHSYYSNVMWSRVEKHVVETAFAGGASKPYPC